jgi:hypothetical protein
MCHELAIGARAKMDILVGGKNPWLDTLMRSPEEPEMTVSADF